MTHTPEEFGPWTTVDVINKGGQGTAYKAVRADSHRFQELAKILGTFVGAHDPKTLFVKGYIAADILRNAGEIRALKVLHQLGNDDAGKRARARMKSEIIGMEKLLHPNLLRLIDYDRDDLRWYVTEFQPGGTLTQAKDRYTGKPLKALRDLRAVVEGVALIHESGGVHRDIKPDNIFLGSSNSLVLGDFGLIFFTEPGARVSETLENVGSRDWMPIWALSMRVEDVRPSFDIFTLGKTLYSMVSRIPHLTGYYHQHPQYPKFHLRQMFEGVPGIDWVNHILSKSVVEHENQIAYKNAGEMLADFERAIADLAKANVTGPEFIAKACMACGIGEYEAIGPLQTSALPKNEKRPVLGVFTCNRCGHTALFSYKENSLYPWPAKQDGLGILGRNKKFRKGS